MPHANRATSYGQSVGLHAMRQNTIKILKIFGAISISILIAFKLSKATVFESMLFALVWGLLALITIVIGIVDVIIKKKLSKYPGTVLIILTLAFGISFPLRKSIWNEKKVAAEYAIEKIERFKKEYGHYPGAINEIESEIELSELNYWTDSLRQEYVVSYDVDGWHTERYNSVEMKWTGGD